jgi:hypothetical protein
MVTKIFDVSFENNLKKFIEEQVLIVMRALMSNLLEEFNKPEYTYWGRWLNPAQASMYCGFKSDKGLRSFCIGRYEPKKINGRVVRYDREALDVLMKENPIDNYKKQLG